MNSLSKVRQDYAIYFTDDIPTEIKVDIEQYNKLCKSDVKSMKKNFNDNQFNCIDSLRESCVKIESTILSKIQSLNLQSDDEIFNKKILPKIKGFLESLFLKKERKGHNFIKKAISDTPELLFSNDGKSCTAKSASLKQSCYIWECHCEKGLKRPDTPGIKGRKEFVQELSDVICSRLPSRTLNRPLRIASIGPGGCFQELIQHAVLTKKFGYKTEWTLIDTFWFEETKEHFLYFSDLIDKGTSVELLEKNGTDYLSELIGKKSDTIPDVITVVDIGVSALESLSFLIEQLRKLNPNLIFAYLNKDQKNNVQMQIN